MILSDTPRDWSQNIIIRGCLGNAATLSPGAGYHGDMMAVLLITSINLAHIGLAGNAREDGMLITC